MSKLRRWPWLAGLVVGLLALGPALAPGALFNLDLVVADATPLPSGIWGLGPELPRRAPFNVVLVLAGVVGASGLAWRLLVLAAFAAAFAGAARLIEPAGPWPRAGAGLLYSLSPFLLTRVGVGHVGILLAAALLPWALPTLARPSEQLERTFLWLCAFALTGYFGGTVAGTLTVVALLVGRRAGSARVVAALVVSQLPWIVPGLIVAAQGPDLADGAPFAAGGAGITGALGLFAGHGFWQDVLQVGGNGGVGVAALGVVVLGLALRGHRHLPEAWRQVAGWAAVVGVGLPLFSMLPVTRELWELAVDTPLVAPIRDVQRLLVLYLVWAAPAASCGAWALARQRRGAVAGVLVVTPVALALALAGPGLWGIGGQLEPVDLPPEWAQARELIEADEGTVLALPWNKYFDLGVAGNRRVHHPAPFYLGGDVLMSSDFELEGTARPRVDPREPATRQILRQSRGGRPVADDLAALGVRWVFVVKDLDWRAYTGLYDDPELEPVVEGDSLRVLRNRAWSGPVLAGDEELELDRLAEPLGTLPASGEARWFAPAQRGWMRGWQPASEGAGGVIALPAGGGPVWYWPTVLVLTAYAVTAVTAVVAARRLVLRRQRSRATPGPPA